MAGWTPKAKAFWPLLAVLVLADCSTKQLAVERLSPPYVPHEVLGDWLRFTLAYNRGAAMGVTFGGYSGIGLALVAVGALAVLGTLYRRSSASDYRRAAALALVAGSAAGNLLDRLRSARGVVDFIDLGVGDLRFWTFNMADIGITGGAVVLAALLAREEQRAAADAPFSKSPREAP
jgi:signal peptidase II